MTNCKLCLLFLKPEALVPLFSDVNYIAFLEPNPDTPGHTVVAPRNHYPTLIDLPDPILKDLIKIIQHVIVKIQPVLNPDGFNIGWNHGEAAGQINPHLHVHILPRWNGDGGGNIHSVIKNNTISFTEVANKFK